MRLRLLPFAILTAVALPWSLQASENTKSRAGRDAQNGTGYSACVTDEVDQELAFLVDSRSRPNVAASMEPIVSTRDIGPIVLNERQEWDAKQITRECPAIMVIHMHTFRTGRISYPISEQRLVRALKIVHDATPLTRIIVYSSSPDSADELRRRLKAAAAELSPQDYGRKFDATIDHVLLLRWPRTPDAADYDRLEDVVGDALSDLRNDVANGVPSHSAGTISANGPSPVSPTPSPPALDATDNQRRGEDAPAGAKEKALDEQIIDFFTSVTGVILALGALIGALLAIPGVRRLLDSQKPEGDRAEGAQLPRDDLAASAPDPEAPLPPPHGSRQSPESASDL